MLGRGLQNVSEAAQRKGVNVTVIRNYLASLIKTFNQNKMLTSHTTCLTYQKSQIPLEKNESDVREN